MNPDPPRAARALGLANIAPLITSPTQAFQRLAERPGRAWVGPMIVSAILITLGAWIMLPQLLPLSYDSAAALMERMGVPEEEMEKALSTMPLEPNATVIATQVLPTLLYVPILMLLGTAFVHLALRVLGGTIRFSESLGMFSLAYVVWALGGLVRGALAAAAGSVEVTLGPGALLPGVEYLSPLGIFLDLFDAFGIWQVFVLVTGISVVARVSRGMAWGVALGYWVIRSGLLASSKVFMMWTQSI